MTQEASRRRSSRQKPFASRRMTRVVLGFSSPDPEGESEVRRDGFAVGPAVWMEGVERRNAG